MSEAPYFFDEFFASGREESISPFLTPRSRSWGKHLSLKSALFSAFLLLVAFAFSFFYENVSLLILCSVYFLSGTPALINTFNDIKNIEINIDVLMTLAALLSVLIGSEMEGALLLVLFELSASMESSVEQKTRSALLHLNRLSPKSAFVLEDNDMVVERAVSDIKPGMRLLIKAGEIIPLDGLVINGSSFLNLVHLTGESAPIPKKEGDEVPAGAYNMDGFLHVSVLRTSHDSTLGRMVQLITHAQEAKPKLEQWLDRFGKWYASSIILLAFVFALILPLVFSIPYLGTEGGIYRALTFLIAASPCALILATPTAYLSALSSCAKKGILLKGGVMLDALAKCSVIAFDKTGTLTTGKLVCKEIESLSDRPICSLDAALAIAAGLERQAVHPIAEAIANLALEKKIIPLEVNHFKATPGFGLEGEFLIKEKWIPTFIGHEAFIASKLPKEKWEVLKKLNRKEHLLTLLLIGDSLFTLHFRDALRPQAKLMVEELKNMRLVMLTGDHFKNAFDVAQELGIKEIFADLRPENKLSKVAEFSEQGLIMIGDGINDAPALARATVGISMGKIGSATAVDASDVIFLNDDLSLLPWVIKKAKKTMRIVKQNLCLALFVILLATTPALLGLVPLWIAVILHEGGSVLVGLNSLRLLKK